MALVESGMSSNTVVDIVRKYNTLKDGDLKKAELQHIIWHCRQGKGYEDISKIVKNNNPNEFY